MSFLPSSSLLVDHITRYARSSRLEYNKKPYYFLFNLFISRSLLIDASAVILAHNHPDGALNPSEQDVETTQRLRQAGEIMGITVLDHIIFNRIE